MTHPHSQPLTMTRQRNDPPSDERTYETLFRLLRGDDVHAFEVLFFRYHRRLCAFAFRYVHTAAIAEELVQDALLSLWDRRTSLDFRADSLRQYLFVTVRNASMSHLRHRIVEQQSEPDIVALVAPSSSADRELNRRELATAMRRAVTALPDRQREVFTMHRWHDMSYADIARVLGISTRTVEVHMGAAFKALRKTLAPFRQ